MDHSNHTCLVYDYGLWPSLAENLGRSFKHVWYFSPWKSAEPKSNAILVGKGLPNVERVDEIWPIKEQVDLWVFPDIQDGPLQWELQEQGHRVWGSRDGDELELYRKFAKVHMKSRDIPIGKYEVVNGISDLRSYLKEHPKVHVKTSRTRGDMESFFSKDYDTVAPRVDEIAYHLGAKQHFAEFIIEDTIEPAIEIGYDGYSVDGQFPKAAMVGIEAKSKAYIGHFLPRDQMPKQVLFLNQQIAPTLKEYQYRNFFTIEARITKDGTPWAIDPCCRMGNPPGSLVMEMYTNLADILWEGAGGSCIDPIPLGKWGAEVEVASTWADKNWQPIRFPASLNQWVKIRNACVIDGIHYAVPQLDERGTIASVIAVGDTAEEAIELCKERGKQVEGYGIDVLIEGLDKALGAIEELKEYKITL